MVCVGTAIGRDRVVAAVDNGGDWRLLAVSSSMVVACGVIALVLVVAEALVLASEAFVVSFARTGTEGKAFKIESLSRLFFAAA